MKAVDIERLIEAHFADELDAEQERQLRAALRDAPEQRAAYDRRARLLRALADEEPTTRETGALWSRLEQALDASAAETAKREGLRGERRAPWRKWLPAAVGIALVVGMLVVGMVIVALVPGGPPVPDRTLKGGSGTGAGGGGDASHTGIEIYAIRPLPRGGFGMPRLVSALEGKLRSDELIQFRYRCTPNGYRYLYLGALIPSPTSTPRVLLYRLTPGSEEPLGITCGAGLHTVPRSIRLAHRHPSGRVQFFALFSRKPNPRARVLAALQAQARGEDRALAPLKESSFVMTTRTCSITAVSTERAPR